MWDRVLTGFRSSSAGRWYYGREPTEQRIIAALVLVVLAVVLWLGLWKPVMDWKTQAANAQRNAQANLDWLAANRAQLATRPDTGGGGEASLRTVSEAARTLGITLNRLQPSDGGISVVLQDQPFNAVLQLVHQLGENNGVTVERASFDLSDSPGRVNANLVLR